MKSNKKRIYFKSLFIVLLLIITSCNYSVSQELTEQIKSDNTSGFKTGKISSYDTYKIIPGDIFSFSIYDEPNYTQAEIVVRPDGQATIEPIGEIPVAGLDINTLTKIIKVKLTSYIRNPQISINIKEFNPASVYIYGAVQKPGMYQQNIQLRKINENSRTANIRNDLTISNIIANSGGITHDADLSAVQISNPNNNDKKIINLWKFLEEGDVSQNILLKSGDIVYIPKIQTILPNDESFKILANSSLFPNTFPVRVIGDIKKPSVYELPSNTPYLQSLIAMGEGYTEQGNKKVVKIFRKNSNGTIAKIYVDPNTVDYVLRPNDLVFIASSSPYKVSRFAEYLVKVLSPAQSISGTFMNWNLYRRGYY